LQDLKQHYKKLSDRKHFLVCIYISEVLFLFKFLFKKNMDKNEVIVMTIFSLILFILFLFLFYNT